MKRQNHLTDGNKEAAENENANQSKAVKQTKETNDQCSISEKKKRNNAMNQNTKKNTIKSKDEAVTIMIGGSNYPKI